MLGAPLSVNSPPYIEMIPLGDMINGALPSLLNLRVPIGLISQVNMTLLSGKDTSDNSASVFV